MGTRFNDLEGTGDFWSLNPNAVKSNYKFFAIFFAKKRSYLTKLNMLTYVLNELQWLNIYASGKLSDRLTAITSERLTLTYQRIFIIEKIPKLFSNIKNTTIAIHLDLYSNFSIQMFIWLSPRKCFRVRGCIRREIRARSGFKVESRVGLGLGISL